MNHTIFWRLMWKEYRLQRAFWIAMTALATVFMLLLWEFNDHPVERAQWLVYTALCMPIFYALGCASTMFAGEHDADTYQFQRSLPVAASQFFWAKIAFAFFSTFAMLALAWLIALVMAAENMPTAVKCRNMWTIAGEMIWLYVIWGVFFSLVLKRPLLAAIVTVTVVTVTVVLIPSEIRDVSLLTDTTFPMLFFYPVTILACFTVLLAIVDIWLGGRWFSENPYRMPRTTRLSRPKAPAKPETLVDYLSRANSWSIMRRLSWQHWRQSAWVLIVIAIMLAPILSVACVSFCLRHEPRPFRWMEYIAPIGVLSALAMPPLVGSFTFLADQRQRSRLFLADRGVRPGLVWISRLWPWLMVLCCAFAIMAAIFAAAYSYVWKFQAMHSTMHEALIVMMILYGYLVLSICVGQFCSMFFRSGLLAAVFSLVITCILCAWAGLMITLGINWLWSVAPLPLVLLLATWLRTPDWLLERGGWRGWRRPALTLVAALVLLFTAVPLYRLYQIPLVDPGFETRSFFRSLNSDEEATLDLYSQAWKKFSLPRDRPDGKNQDTQADNDPTTPIPQPWPQDIEWVKANKEAIPLIIEASKGWQFVFTPSSLIGGRGNPMDVALTAQELAELLAASARLLESEGKLDAAADQYLAVFRICKQLRSGVIVPRPNTDKLEIRAYQDLRAWSAHSGQTAGQIKDSVAQLEKITADMPAGVARVEFGYLYYREMLRDRFKGFSHIPAKTALWLHVPWERARAMRLLNVITKHDLETVTNAEMAARLNQRIHVPPVVRDRDRDASAYTFTDRDYYPFNVRDSEYALVTDVWVPPMLCTPQGSDLVRRFAGLENLRRATLIMLALQAWKLEHGEYPEKLDDLVGAYLQRLPNDPYSGEPYQYYPAGVEILLPAAQAYFALMPFGPPPPPRDRPVIWSTSPDVIVARPSEQIFAARYMVYDCGEPGGEQEPRFRAADSFEVYKAGYFFMLPQASAGSRAGE